MDQTSSIAFQGTGLAAPPSRLGALARHLRRLARRCADIGNTWAYARYEARLLSEVRARPVPCHVGIILDGNRRHARDHGLRDFRRIYEMGAGKLDEVLDWCAALGVGAVTLWVCSTDNLARPAEEVSGILAAIEAKMLGLAADPRLHRLGVRVQAIGRVDLLPASLVGAIERARRATEANRQMTLTIAANYGGREEIADALRSLLRECAAQRLTVDQATEVVTPEAIGRHLYSPSLPDPDLIIRTSGELRLSGFLLWQSVHSEYHFTDVNWPAFRRIDFLRAIRTYQARERRFGR
ncbi:MAG: di-trans,poly-cis-decaprenylcistransferase [Acetobacteraceae bacterium]|nr:di-trans,poly-cis-decaprenylcistransferase [Acetobacteraceae bacterium]